MRSGYLNSVLGTVGDTDKFPMLIKSNFSRKGCVGKCYKWITEVVDLKWYSMQSRRRANIRATKLLIDIFTCLWKMRWVGVL